MNSNELRKAVLDNPLRVQRVRLNKNQVLLYKSIASQGMDYEITTSMVAAMKSCSIQCAWNKLELLKRKGYLTRRSETQPSGGCESFYKAVQF